MTHDLETLRYTERRLAALVVANAVYVPLFARVQKEIEIISNTQDTLAKAKAIADSYKAVA